METWKFELYDEIYESEQRLRRACNQIIHINGRLEDLHRRYNVAKNNNNKCFRLSIRNRILVAEGMLTAYCMYATEKRREVIKMREEIAHLANDTLDFASDSD